MERKETINIIKEMYKDEPTKQQLEALKFAE